LLLALVAAIDRCLADPAYQEYFADDDYGDDEEEEGEDEAARTLAELCPEAYAGIGASALGPFLTADWSDWTPPEKLERVRALLAAPVPDEAHRPDPAAVSAIVAKTQAAVAAPARSLWARFKDWLRSLLGEEESGSDSGWLSDWLAEHLPVEKAFTLVTWLLIAALVAGIGWVAYTELRAAGLLQRWRARRKGSAIAPAAAPGMPSLAGASAAETPSILVALLVAELRRLGLVQDRLSMTHRELGRAARFEAAADREAFGEVLGAAESLRYSPSPPAPDFLAPVIDAGRGLLDRLARQPRGAT